MDNVQNTLNRRFKISPEADSYIESYQAKKRLQGVKLTKEQALDAILLEQAAKEKEEA